MNMPHWASSLRFRLLAATVAGIALALVLAGLVLASLFRDHTSRQFQQGLALQLDELTARVAFGPDGEPVMDTRALSDPRWNKPYSGLYWQIDGDERSGLMRSRSLWDTSLALASDVLSNGQTHVHGATGPGAEPLLVLERTVHAADHPHLKWRLAVAADTRPLDAAVSRFQGVLAASLTVLFVLLVLAALAQVILGLSPLRSLQGALAAVRDGRTARLQGRFPAELQPLVDEFNGVLERNAALVERARHHAGNLAHAVRTPLAVMAQAAERAQQQARAVSGGPGAAGATEAEAWVSAHLVREQLATANRHIDWHLARSRVAAVQGLPGQHVRLGPVLQGLIRVMQKIHADRQLIIGCDPVAPDLAFAGEEQDLQEMLGNLLDNACKWAASTVHVSVAQRNEPGRSALLLSVEDDGPGLDAAQHQRVVSRGVRMDESVPGTGLGLAIVSDLLHLYGGRMTLGRSSLGGLKLDLELPAAGRRTSGADT